MNSDANAITSSVHRYDTVTIFGVGLLGGSIAAAIKQRDLAQHIIGCGRNAARLEAAQHSGLIDAYHTDLKASVKDSELVIVCTPVSQIVPAVKTIASSAKPGTLITDVGSVKLSICTSLDSLPSNDIHFVGSHPMAGSEQSGFEHADANLFQDRVTVVTPTANTNEQARIAIQNFWQSVGSEVVILSPQQHDRAVAETSHLPHLIAAVLAAGLNEEVERVAATGFRDTTRIASGEPDMWTGILLQNREEILQSIAGFEQRLQQFRTCVQNQDAAGLKKWLQVAKTKRDTLYRQNKK